PRPVEPYRSVGAVGVDLTGGRPVPVRPLAGGAHHRPGTGDGRRPQLFHRRGRLVPHDLGPGPRGPADQPRDGTQLAGSRAPTAASAASGRAKAGPPKSLPECGCIAVSTSVSWAAISAGHASIAGQSRKSRLGMASVAPEG